jgi:predicted nucleic acid-binding protein
VPGILSGVCRDPKDDFILECAVLGNADVIVTGDKDLLALGEYEGIRIVTPRQYLDME